MVAMNGHVEKVIVSNKVGLVAIEPRVVIDCTGDGDAAAWAGAAFAKAESLQPMSLHFRIAYLQPTYELRRRCAAVLKKAHERGDLGLYAGPDLATFSECAPISGPRAIRVTIRSRRIGPRLRYRGARMPGRCLNCGSGNWRNLRRRIL